MKHLSKLVLCAALLPGCAFFQGKPSKFDKLESAVQCRLDLLKPYQDYLTEENLKGALSGSVDPVDTLRAMNLSVADIAKFIEGWNACAKAEKAE